MIHSLLRQSRKPHLDTKGHIKEINEDFLTHKVVGNLHFLSVMDGCSGGKDSVFASNLFGKIFNKYFQIDPTGLSLSQISLEINEYLWRNVFYIKDILGLQTNELESTFICLIFNADTKEYYCSFVGDGYLMVDGELTENPQDNKPKYVSHFDKRDTFLENVNVFAGVFQSSIGIASDGIKSFVDFASNTKIEIGDYFFRNARFPQNPTKLSRLYKLLIEGNGVAKALNHDDVAIIYYEC